MPKNIRLAIFDIDGTIFRSSLIIELFNELVARSIFPVSAQEIIERNYKAWLDRKGHYNDYLMKLVAVFYKNLAGRSVQHVDAAVQETISRQKNRVYRYPRQLFQELKKKGYFLLVISNSPAPMVKQFAKAMGFHAAVGHELHTDRGVYTGRSIVDGKLMPGYAWMDKVRELERFASSKNMNIDMKGSVMIGDSEGDLPLLSIVGNPIAFNPSLPLARIAQRRGWQVIVERKDAVYRIRAADFVSVAGQKPRIPYGNKKR